MRYCKPTNIPKTDETPLTCEDYISDVCVFVEEAIPFIGTRDNMSLEEFHAKLIEKLVFMSSSIADLTGGVFPDLTNILRKTGETTQTLEGELVIGNKLRTESIQGKESLGATLDFTGGTLTISAANGIFFEESLDPLLKGKYLSLDPIDGSLVFTEPPKVTATSEILNDGATGASTYIEQAYFNTVLDSLVDLPTYVQPTSTISGVPTTVQKGSDITNLSVTIGFTQNDAGAATQKRLYVNGTLVGTGNVVVVNLQNVQDDVTFYAEVDYAQGPIKNDRLGRPRPEGRISAGTKTSVTKTATATENVQIYFGAADTIGNYTVLPQSASKAINEITLVTGDEKMKFVVALPASKEIVSVFDETNNFTITNEYKFIETAIIQDSTGANINYNIYALEIEIPYVPSANHRITLKDI